MYWILDSLSVELGFGFQSLVGLRIPCAVIPDSKAQDSGFIAKNLLDSGFQDEIRPVSSD